MANFFNKYLLTIYQDRWYHKFRVSEEMLLCFFVCTRLSKKSRRGPLLTLVDFEVPAGLIIDIGLCFVIERVDCFEIRSRVLFVRWVQLYVMNLPEVAVKNVLEVYCYK